MSHPVRASLRVAMLVLPLALLATSPVGATPVPNAVCPPLTTTDLWDSAQGVTIATDSGFGAGIGMNMFGEEGASAEPGVSFFADGNPDGFLAFVEWSTVAPVTIRSIHLYAAHDGNSQQRSFTAFRLYAVTGATRQLLYEHTPDLPYGGGESGNVLNLCDDIAQPVEAQRYRAEFVQNGGFQFPGTRVMELDGFDQTVAALIPTPSPGPATPAAATPTAAATVSTPVPGTPAPSPSPAAPGGDGSGGDSPYLVVIGGVIVIVGAAGLWYAVRRRRTPSG